MHIQSQPPVIFGIRYTFQLGNYPVKPRFLSLLRPFVDIALNHHQMRIKFQPKFTYTLTLFYSYTLIIYIFSIYKIHLYPAISAIRHHPGHPSFKFNRITSQYRRDYYHSPLKNKTNAGSRIIPKTPHTPANKPLTNTFLFEENTPTAPIADPPTNTPKGSKAYHSYTFRSEEH